MNHVQRSLLALFAALLLGAMPTASFAQGFYNPVAEHSDPFITYTNGNYYFLSTNLSTDITVTASASLANLYAQPAVNVYSFNGCFESPELFGYGGLWYIYLDDCNGPKIDVLESDSSNPQGSYHFKATLVNGGYDQSILQMPNGSFYLLYSTFQHLNIQPMSNPYTMSGGATVIANVDQGWEGSIIEDPFPVIHNGQLSVVYAANAYNSNNYGEGLLVFDNGCGDVLNAGCWSKRSGPIFRGNGQDAFGAGTATFFSSPDGTQTWLAYDAYRRNDYSSDTRDSRVQQVSWNGDNTPNLGSAASLTTNLPLPSGDPGIGSTVPYPGGWYRLLNQTSNPNTGQPCLDDSGGLTSPQSSIEVYTCNDLPPQNFQILPVAGGAFKLMNQQSGLALDNSGGSQSLGAQVGLYYDNYQAPQHWRFNDQSNGYFALTNDGSNGLCLDEASGNPAPGTNVQLYSCNNQPPQNWLLSRVF